MLRQNTSHSAAKPTCTSPAAPRHCCNSLAGRAQNAAGQSARATEAEGEHNKACRHLEKSQAAYLEASQKWQMPCRRLFSMERKLRRTGCTFASGSGPLDQEPRKLRRNPCYQGQGLAERKPKEESTSLPKEESASLLKRPNEKNGESAPTRMNGREWSKGLGKAPWDLAHRGFGKDEHGDLVPQRAFPWQP